MMFATSVVKLERFSPFTIAELAVVQQSPATMTLGPSSIGYKEIFILRMDPIEVRGHFDGVHGAELHGWPPGIVARFPATDLGWRMARKAASV